MPNSLIVKEKQLSKATQVHTLGDHPALYPITDDYKEYVHAQDNPDVFAMMDFPNSPNASFVARGDWVIEELQEDGSGLGLMFCSKEDFNELYEEVKDKETLDKHIVFTTIMEFLSRSFNSYELSNKVTKELLKLMEDHQNASI